MPDAASDVCPVISPPSYVAGTENFYVINRYNWSCYNAFEVIELGRVVIQGMSKP